MTWNARGKGWMGPPRARAPVEPAPPPSVRPAVVQIPGHPVFSPAAIAALLQEYRSTVQYWMDHGKLDSFRDNIGDRYVMRAELIRFVREYLKRTCQEE